jgi:ADP-glucose pyrophosphorylase
LAPITFTGMNIRQMIEFHVEKRSGVTVAAIPVEKELAPDFGVIETTCASTDERRAEDNRH